MVVVQLPPDRGRLRGMLPLARPAAAGAGPAALRSRVASCSQCHQTARPLFENPPGLLFHVGKWWGERDPGDAVAGSRPPGQVDLRAVPTWGLTSPCGSVGVRRRTSTKDASPWRRLRAGSQMASTRLLCWGRGSVFGYGRSGSALPRRGPPPLQGRPWNEGGHLPDRHGDPPAHVRPGPAGEPQIHLRGLPDSDARHPLTRPWREGAMVRRPQARSAPRSWSSRGGTLSSLGALRPK